MDKKRFVELEREVLGAMGLSPQFNTTENRRYFHDTLSIPVELNYRNPQTSFNSSEKMLKGKSKDADC